MEAGHALHERAVELLQAVRAGDRPSGELARAFASSVGEGLEPVNRLVAAVLAGGPFTIRRAMELAVLVLHSNADAGTPASGGDPRRIDDSGTVGRTPRTGRKGGATGA